MTAPGDRRILSEMKGETKNRESLSVRLLFPPHCSGERGCETWTLPEESKKDLGLPLLVETMAGKELSTRSLNQLLSTLPLDPEIIRYRQEVFEDFYRSRELREVFMSCIPKIDELIYLRKTKKEHDIPLFQAVWRLGELELYVDIMEELHELFQPAKGRNYARPGSRGLTLLGEEVERRVASEDFQSLKRELPHLSRGFKRHSSVIIGCNLDRYLRPVEAGIIAMGEEPIKESSTLSRIFGGKAKEYSSITPLHSTPPFTETGEKLPLAPLFQDIDQILRAGSKELAKSLDRYLDIHTDFLDFLHSDASFFIAAAEYARRLSSLGLPVSRPEILPGGPGEVPRFSAKGLYNPNLAFRLEKGGRTKGEMNISQAVVTNHIDFDQRGRVFILTGPNRGGKTTFLQSLGLCQVLAQAGCYVPAEEALCTPADLLFTHFPSREDASWEEGRLGEEAMRLSGMFDQITERSFVLLNEALTSTSPAEGIVLARDVIRGLSLSGARAVFATHFHQLGLETEELSQEISPRNSDSDGKTVSRVDSLVAETEDRERTFKISRKPAEGKSYAEDIAKKFNLDLPALKEKILTKRKNIEN